MSMYGVIMVSSKERHSGARSAAITARHNAIHSAPLMVVAIMSSYECTHTHTFTVFSFSASNKTVLFVMIWLLRFVSV